MYRMYGKSKYIIIWCRLFQTIIYSIAHKSHTNGKNFISFSLSNPGCIAPNANWTSPKKDAIIQLSSTVPDGGRTYTQPLEEKQNTHLA